MKPRVRIMPPVRTRDGEYVVRVYVDGRRCPERDYFTDDRDDARGTFLAMVQEANRMQGGDVSNKDGVA